MLKAARLAPTQTLVKKTARLSWSVRAVFKNPLPCERRGQAKITLEREFGRHSQDDSRFSVACLATLGPGVSLAGPASRISAGSLGQRRLDTVERRVDWPK
jgi:hypothetical protein